MQVNTSKTRIMIFSNKKKQSHHTFFFEDNILEEVNEYKDLAIDFNNKLNWEDFIKKRIFRRWKASKKDKGGEGERLRRQGRDPTATNFPTIISIEIVRSCLYLNSFPEIENSGKLLR